MGVEGERDVSYIVQYNNTGFLGVKTLHNRCAYAEDRAYEGRDGLFWVLQLGVWGGGGGVNV